MASRSQVAAGLRAVVLALGCVVGAVPMGAQAQGLVAMQKVSAPLANVDKITVVSTGNGDATGMNKITGDFAKMAAQVPALFESLSGMSMTELLGKVRAIGDKTPKPPETLPPANSGKK